MEEIGAARLMPSLRVQGGTKAATTPSCRAYTSLQSLQE